MVTVCRKWISHRKPIRISPSIRRSVQGMHRPVGFLADGFPYIGRRDQDDQPASGLEIPLGNPIWKSHGSERIIMEANDGGNIWKHYRTKWIYIKYIKLIWIEERYALSWVMSSTLSARVNALEYVLIPRIEDQDSYHCHKAARAIDESHMFHFFPSNFLTAFGWFGQLRTSSTTSHRRWMSRQDVLSQIVPQAHPWARGTSGSSCSSG